jgi:DNA-binding transcriptional MerR regulator
MNEKPMTVHQVAELTGITVRTLHYYDEIGLLKPEIVTEAKYRLYTQTDLGRLQEILFFKEVGFALKEINKLMTSDSYDREEALQNPLQILELQKKRIDNLIKLVNDRISGKQEYSFDAFSTAKIIELQGKFREEVIERWGDTESYQQFTNLFGKKAQKVQQEQWDKFLATAKNIFEHLAEYEDKDPSEREVQSIIRQWKDYISENFYQCNNQMLMYLGELYTMDERFKEFINRFGTGDLALFFSKAIEVFCAENKERV